MLRLNSRLAILKQGERQNRRHLIIAATRELFRGKSILGIGIREIAQTVGVSAGAIYNYFPGGRDALFFEVLVQEIAALKAGMGKKRTRKAGFEALAQEGINQLLDNDLVYQLMCYFIIRAKVSGENQGRLETARLIVFRFFDSLIATQCGSDEMGSLNDVLFASVMGSYLAYVNFPGMSPRDKREKMQKLALELIQDAHV